MKGKNNCDIVNLQKICYKMERIFCYLIFEVFREVEVRYLGYDIVRLMISIINKKSEPFSYKENLVRIFLLGARDGT